MPARTRISVASFEVLILISLKDYFVTQLDGAIQWPLFNLHQITQHPGLEEVLALRSVQSKQQKEILTRWDPITLLSFFGTTLLTFAERDFLQNPVPKPRPKLKKSWPSVKS